MQRRPGGRTEISMNIQQLQYFLEATRTLNFTRTAEKFYISPSAIIQQIRKLETELDVKLFEQKHKKLYLTPAGEIFAGEASALIARTQEAIEKVQSVKEGHTGQLHIGYLRALELDRFPITIQNFHCKYPGVKLKLERLHEQDLYEQYMSGKFDVIFNISRDFYTYPDTEALHLIYYGFSVAMPQNHRLAGKKIIRTGDLTGEPLIMHDCNQSGSREQTQGSWQIIPSDLYDNIISVEQDNDTALVLVAAGLGVAILPDFDLGVKKTNLHINYVPMDTDGHKAEIKLYYRKGNHNPVLPLFVQECRAAD